MVFLLFLYSAFSFSQDVAKSALDNLVNACQASHSNSVSVLYKGKNVLDTNFTLEKGLTPCHSVLKSIASLTVGRLILEGKLRNVDEPVCTIFPEWKQGLKRNITIKHLLNHTSGIEFNDTNDNYFAARDVVQHALCANVVDTPGSKFVYNSKAFLLLLGVIGKSSGIRTDTYIEQTIFQPLGIKQFKWDYDAAGNVIGLSTTSSELVKVGQLILNQGIYNDKEIVSGNWISQMLEPSQPFAKDCGLLWWLIPQTTHYIVDERLLVEFKQAGVKQSIIDKFRLLKGNYVDVNIPSEKLQAVFGPNWQSYLEREFYPYFPRRSRRELGSKIIGYKAEGYLGQYIIVYPEKGIVAARMVRETAHYRPETDEMLDFEKYVYDLVK